MEFDVAEIAGGATKIVLRGRFDTTAAVLIEMPFNSALADKKAVIVDLSAIDFLSSYGVRVLLMGAKMMAGKGRKLVIMCPDNNVGKVLRTAGIGDVVPVLPNEQAALAAVTA